MSADRKVSSLLNEKNGLIRTADAVNTGISRATISQLAKNGKIERIAHGQYIQSGDLPDELHLLQQRSKKIVFRMRQRCCCTIWKKGFKENNAMNKNTLLKELENKNIPKDSYDLNGGLPNEAYCLNQNNGIWEVYYSEKGVKSGVKTFSTENDACNYLHRKII